MLNFIQKKREEEMAEIFTIKNIIIYLVAINIIGFFAMWIVAHRRLIGRNH